MLRSHFNRHPLLYFLLAAMHGMIRAQTFSLTDPACYSEMARLVQRVLPSIVSIQAYGQNQQGEQCWVGSGFIYDKEGYILTRESVIGQGDSIVVTFVDGRSEAAWVVHSDSKSELVLLKLERSGLYALKSGFSTDLKSKMPLLVVGNSLGVFPSVTLSSFLGRRRDGMLRLGGIVPPGNSGSPVFDQAGRVVGVLAGRILYDTGANQDAGEDLGVAFPIELVQQAVDLMVHRMKQGKGWIGISAVNLDGNQIKGVRTVSVKSGGPAMQAGICVGDTIVAFEGRVVRDAGQLAEWVRSSIPDKSVSFTVKNGSREILHTVRVVYAPWAKSKRIF